jgi:hypothetical protein
MKLNSRNNQARNVEPSVGASRSTGLRSNIVNIQPYGDSRKFDSGFAAKAAMMSYMLRYVRMVSTTMYFGTV